MNGSLPWLDLVLLLVLLGYAVSGWRQGFIAAAFSLAGFLGGAALAMWALPQVLGRWDPGLDQGVARAALLVAGVLAGAFVGQAVGGAIGRRLREEVRLPAVRAVDGALGLVALVAAASVLLWFVADALRGSSWSAADRAVEKSSVVRAIDAVVPQRTAGLFAAFGTTLQEHGFPRVFEGLGPEPFQAVDPPQRGVAARPAVRAAAGSVVSVTGQAPSCGEVLSGSGWVLSGGRVVTNAHVVAGAEELVVQVGGRGTRHPARVVLFDPVRDIAVLVAPRLDAPALRWGPDLGRDDDAVVAGFPLGGPYRASTARVRATLRAPGETIYGEPGAVREVYALRASVRPGNSGGPLLDTSGRVVGVVFAASLDHPDTGYALTLDEVRSDLDRGRTAQREVSTGECVAAA